MSAKPGRDIEKDYPLPDFIDKLRRLADALEQGKQYEISIAGERIVQEGDDGLEPQLVDLVDED